MHVFGAIGFFYVVFYCYFGTQLPFLPLWLEQAGLNAALIGLVPSFAQGLRIFAGPLLSALADRTGASRLLLILFACAITALNSIFAFFPVNSSILFLSAVLVWGASGIVPTMIDSFALKMESASSYSFSMMRSLGSWGFLALGLGSGYILERIGVSQTVHLLFLLACLMIIAALFLPKPQKTVKKAKNGIRRRSITYVRIILHKPNYLRVFIAVSSLQGAHGVYYILSSLYWVTYRGYTTREVSVLWAVGVLAEIILLMNGKKVRRYVSYRLLLGAGAFFSIVRWGSFTFAETFWLSALLQVTHAATFAATYLGMMAFLRASIPVRMLHTSVALITNFGVGIVVIAVTLTGGYAYAHVGPFWAFFAPTLLGCVAALVLLTGRTSKPRIAFAEPARESS